MKKKGNPKIASVAAIVFVVLFVTANYAPAVDDDRVLYPSCAYCGMNRTKFAHSRAIITYEDGSEVAICSLHCAAIDLSLRIDKTPTAVRVADYVTKNLLDADSAYWVIGGGKMGVMTKRAKWAFASEDDARAFIADHGGSTAEFETAIRSAFEDMYADLQMIREKRKKMQAMKK